MSASTSRTSRSPSTAVGARKAGRPARPRPGSSWSTTAGTTRRATRAGLTTRTCGSACPRGSRCRPAGRICACLQAGRAPPQSQRPA
ncbi:hypothetical protein C0Q96_28995 [Streptomyces albidoflavus]|nr:hypothetical protein C0Q96_28995 [Streptomyces albidoflavus]